MKVGHGAEVTIEFTMSLEDNTVVGSNVDGEPVVFVHGAGQMFPVLEQALVGTVAGDSRHVTLAPDDAYGPRDPDAVQQLDKSRVPEGAWQVGAELRAEEDDAVRARVIEIRDDVIVVDFNHPLAGETLSFDVTVLGVKAKRSDA